MNDQVPDFLQGDDVALKVDRMTLRFDADMTNIPASVVLKKGKLTSQAWTTSPCSTASSTSPQPTPPAWPSSMPAAPPTCPASCASATPWARPVSPCAHADVYNLGNRSNASWRYYNQQPRTVMLGVSYSPR